MATGNLYLLKNPSSTCTPSNEWIAPGKYSAVELMMA